MYSITAAAAAKSVNPNLAVRVTQVGEGVKGQIGRVCVCGMGGLH